jgi:hypothetical protein
MKAIYFSLLIAIFGINLILNSSIDDDVFITDEDSEILNEFNENLKDKDLPENNKNRLKRQTQDLLKTYIDNLKNVIIL